MFRDREKALQELQEQLLEEEENTLPEEDAQDDLPSEIYEAYTEDVRARNSDTTDIDLDDYSDQVYEAPRGKNRFVLWFILLTAAVLLLLSWFLAKQGGLL